MYKIVNMYNIWRSFWILKWQKWIPWVKLPLNPYIARLSMSTNKEITLFVIFWSFFGGHFVFSRFEGRNVIFQLGNSDFWIQQVQITLKTLVAKN